MSNLSNGKGFGPNGDGVDDYLMLSETGRMRRDAMLVELQGVVVVEGRRRSTRRRAMRSASVVALMIGFGFMLVGMWPTARMPTVVSTQAKPELSSYIQIVQTRPEAVAAMIALPAGDLSHYYVNDRELVDALASIGRPSGLIRRGGVVRLASKVTDQ